MTNIQPTSSEDLIKSMLGSGFSLAVKGVVCYSAATDLGQLRHAAEVLDGRGAMIPGVRPLVDLTAMAYCGLTGLFCDVPNLISSAGVLTYRALQPETLPDTVKALTVLVGTVYACKAVYTSK
jgi:hypothetical protein